MSAKKTYIEELALNGDIPPTFYDKIGDNLIMDLQNLINTVVERYKLLKEIESLTQKRSISAIAQKIPSILKWTDADTINNDISSHFILALIMCKNDGDARWFIKQESSLYKARLEQSKRYDMYKILSSLGMNLNLFDKNKDKVDIN